MIKLNFHFKGTGLPVQMQNKKVSHAFGSKVTSNKILNTFKEQQNEHNFVEDGGSNRLVIDPSYLAAVSYDIDPATVDDDIYKLAISSEKSCFEFNVAGKTRAVMEFNKISKAFDVLSNKVGEVVSVKQSKNEEAAFVIDSPLVDVQFNQIKEKSVEADA